jgi:hypothetical protein
MKTLLKIWMYICTFLVSANILLTGAVMIWILLQEESPILTTSEGHEIDVSGAFGTEPEILELFAAVEANDLKTIYQYAAPELKEKISYERFSRDQWPNVTTEDIQVVSGESGELTGSNTEHILLILRFRENGIEHYSSMRWEKNSGSIYYDTFPFKVSMLSEFGSFPTHMAN